VNLKEWAAAQGISYATACRWYESGKLPVPARKVGGLILIGDQVVPVAPVGSTATYAGVSSADQRPDLDRQFLSLLRDPGVATIVAEHRDRFVRFGDESTTTWSRM
jgi:predicted site-specific integrase-resolvase